jgi:hypothetical protein
LSKGWTVVVKDVPRTQDELRGSRRSTIAAGEPALVLLGAELDWEQCGRQLDEEVKAGCLDRLFDRARHEAEAGLTAPL